MKGTNVLVIIGICLALSGCGTKSTGVSQEEYERVVSERDSYKQQLEEIQSVDSWESSTEPDIPEGKDDGNEEQDEDELSKQVQVKEYVMENSFGDSYYLLVVKNNSDRTISLEVNSIAKDSEGKTVGAASSSGEAIGSGHEVCLMNYFESVKSDSTFEYTMSVKEDDYYESVLGDLTHEDSDTGEKVIVTCTNNGDKVAEFVEGAVLFFLGDKLVGYETNYLTDDDSELKPGASIAKEFEFYGEEDYDRFEVYLKGRR